MNVQTDSVPVSSPTGGSSNGPRTVPPLARREEQDLELIARVARGEVEALQTLATRMAPRVERVARALMGGSLDARDAALHALIELMRSHTHYRGKLRLERWGDRVAALCVMRFARAVSRRNGQAEPEAPLQEPTSERVARTFEQYLGMLDSTSRQILLLRHALGFSISELAELLQCSPQSARERLLASRRAFRALVRRRESRSPASDGGRDSPVNSTAGLGLGVQRWCALRDREALGEPLAPEEVEEVAALEAKEPEIWAYVTQVRALELYFDPRNEPRGPIDGTMVERAVEVIKVSSPTIRQRALVDDNSPHESRVEGDGANWIGVAAWSVSASLAIASGLALYWYRPEPALVPAPMSVRDPRSAALAPAPLPPPKPTVESLPSVRTAARGARLHSAGRVLAEGTLLGQDDTLEAVDKAGCVEIEPAFEACLAPGTALTFTSLQRGVRQLTLVRGRVVARGNEQNGNASIVVRGDGVEASTDRGAFAFERASDGASVRVRALRGRLALATAREQRSFEEGQGAQVRVVDGTVSIAPVASAWLQRDWDVLATGLHAVAPPPVRSPAKAREDVVKLEQEQDVAKLEQEQDSERAEEVEPTAEEPVEAPTTTAAEEPARELNR